jgi:hypothetical protein
MLDVINAAAGVIVRAHPGGRFLSRGEAEACYHAAPADASLRPDGTPNRPSSVYRVAFEYEPPGLPPVAQNPRHQSLLEQLDLDGAI